MPRFRASAPNFSGPITPEGVRAVVAECMRPAHFFLGPDLTPEWQHVPAEELSWEIFRGRLLDPAQTRQRRTFEAWSVVGAGGDPLVSVKLDAAAGQLHVVRGLDSYVWEGYDAGNNVYLSREARKWVCELVGTVRLDRFADLGDLADELICRLFQAVVGTSRLPLSSVESPLPAFSFGQLFYCHRHDTTADAGPVRGWRDLTADMLAPGLHPSEESHLLETFLHAVPDAEMDEAAETFARRWSEVGHAAAELARLLRRMFNEVSLSPFTDLIAKTLLFLRALQEREILRAEGVADFLGYMLRHIGRHLTAFDLVVFHHRGANYPDALLLDAVLKEYLALVERSPELFLDAADEEDPSRRQKRLRRRGLRQGWLLRRRYEGHPVPDLPTSPGENMRVLPPSHARVPEEQITQPGRRRRRLYADDPLPTHLGPRAAECLRRSLLDVEHAEEWREMGTAVFLDRPLGDAKAAAEPDATLLLSAEAFSAAVARQRLLALAGDLGLSLDDADVRRLLEQPEISGLSPDLLGDPPRPGTVSLTDARRAAPDIVFLRTTPGSARAFLAQFDFTPLRERFPLDDLLGGADVLIARVTDGSGLLLYDARHRPRVDLELAGEEGYESRAGVEYPAGGLRVRRVWTAGKDGAELLLHDLRRDPLRLPPR